MTSETLTMGVKGEKPSENDADTAEAKGRRKLACFQTIERISAYFIRSWEEDTSRICPKTRRRPEINWDGAETRAAGEQHSYSGATGERERDTGGRIWPRCTGGGGATGKS